MSPSWKHLLALVARVAAVGMLTLTTQGYFSPDEHSKEFPSQSSTMCLKSLASDRARWHAATVSFVQLISRPVFGLMTTPDDLARY